VRTIHAMRNLITSEVVALADCINGPHLRGLEGSYQPGDIVKGHSFEDEEVGQYQEYFRIVKRSSTQKAEAMLARYRADVAQHGKISDGRRAGPLMPGLNWYEVGGE
jgi:hypothetical protein